MFYKPCIILKDEWDKLVASCRSPNFFSIIKYLDKYQEYLMYYWWHKQAAWFSIKKEKFEIFQKKISQEINLLDFSQYKKKIEIDKIITPEEFWFTLIETMNIYKPYWIGNKKPVFMFQNFPINQVVYLWKTMEHISLKNKYNISLLWFGFWEYMPILKSVKNMDIIFDIMDDFWMWKRVLKCKIIDIILE
jgi:single-stranded-DNA-specific exonuclease